MDWYLLSSEKKIVEFSLRWFGHERKRLRKKKKNPVRRVDHTEDSPIIRDRGGGGP